VSGENESTIPESGVNIPICDYEYPISKVVGFGGGEERQI
jgi:hypothetical protein